MLYGRFFIAIAALAGMGAATPGGARSSEPGVTSSGEERTLVAKRRGREKARGRKARVRTTDEPTRSDLPEAEAGERETELDEPAPIAPPPGLPPPPELPAQRTVGLLPLEGIETGTELLRVLEGALVNEIEEVAGSPGITPADVLGAASAFGLDPAACAEDAACLGRVGRYARAHEVIATKVAVIAGVTNLSLRVIDTQTGKELHRVADTVADEPLARATDLHRLVVQLLAPATYIGSLAIRCTVDGADVYLDDVIVGQTPLEGALEGLEAGTHILRVSKPGYSDIYRFVDVVYLRSSTIEVDLENTTIAGQIVGKDPTAGLGSLFVVAVRTGPDGLPLPGGDVGSVALRLPTRGSTDSALAAGQRGADGDAGAAASTPASQSSAETDAGGAITDAGSTDASAGAGSEGEVGGEVVPEGAGPADGAMSEAPTGRGLAGIEIRIDGEPIGATPFAEPVEITAGSHKLSARAEGMPLVTESVQIVAGERTDIALRVFDDRIEIGAVVQSAPDAELMDPVAALSPPPPEPPPFVPPPPRYAPSWRLWGGVAGAALGLGTLGLAGYYGWEVDQRNQRARGLEARATGSSGDDDEVIELVRRRDSLAERGTAAESRQWISLAVGATVTAAGAALLISEVIAPYYEAVPEATTDVQVGLGPSPGGAHVVLGGTW